MGYYDYIDFKKVKKILVIKLRHLGDVLLTTPVFYNLKKELSDVKVDAFVYEDCESILKNNLYIDEVISYDKKIKKLSFLKRLKKEFEIYNYIRKKNYDLVINLTEGDRGAIIAFFSKAKYKVGLDSKNKGFYKKDKIFSHIVKMPGSSRHAAEKNLDALRRIGLFAKEENKRLHFFISQESNDYISNILKENNFEKGSYILIHPTTRWRFKSYNKFDKLIEKLLSQKLKVIVVSGKEDYEIQMANQIVKNFDVLNLAGKVTIDELASLILFSKRFYCLDSFSFHLANALKANVYALFGPTCDITWGIWKNENAKIITSNMSCRPCSLDGCAGSKVSDCLHAISVEDLL